MKKKSKQFKKGFTIAEVVIAGFVLTTGIAATLSLMSASTAESISSRNSIIASELAQEGIELVRNIRDNEMVNGTYNDASLAESDNCIIDSNSSAISCISGYAYDDYALYLDGDNFYRHHIIGTGTRFARKITIGNDVQGDGSINKIIRSIVTWDGQIRTFDACTIEHSCVKVEDVLTNWN